ncbi:hypothetical protein J6590_091832 [Homalodisca vitripennis]|nr:hypothetical protein J6590_091832 [Homalodisca vitripennis]
MSQLGNISCLLYLACASVLKMAMLTYASYALHGTADTLHHPEGLPQGRHSRYIAEITVSTEKVFKNCYRRGRGCDKALTYSKKYKTAQEVFENNICKILIKELHEIKEEREIEIHISECIKRATHHSRTCIC